MAVREPVFSHREIEFIGEQASKYKAILDSHFNDFSSKRIKDQTWKRIALDLNSKHMGPKRSAEKVKKQWYNLKCKAKKILSSEKRESMKTGGGPSSSLGIDDFTRSIAYEHKEAWSDLGNHYDDRRGLYRIGR